MNWQASASMKVSLSATALLLTMACAPLPNQAAAPRPETPTMAPDLEGPVRAARAAAARHTGLAPDAHAVLGAERVTWSDGSLGCPAPDRMYTQSLVPGYRVRLRGPDGELDVHLDARGNAMLCPPGRALAPLPSDGRTAS
jgi:hypothetical protein